MKIFEATIKDIRQLAIHHRKMFKEICEQEGQQIEEDKLEELEKAYCKKLEKQFPEDSCRAWIAKETEQIVASGGITIVSFVPIPNDTNHNIAYLHSMYTEREFRGQKLAHKIIDKAIQYCKKIGINRIILNASDAGKPIYEAYGFNASAKSMVSFINK